MKFELDESQAGIKIAGKNNNHRFADDTTVMAESEEKLKSLLVRVNEESEKTDLKLKSHQFMANGGGKWKQWQIFFLASKISVDGDCSQEIKRHLFLGRKATTSLDNVLKNRDITLLTKICIVKGMVFPVVTYRCESWSIKKAEHWRIDALNCHAGEDSKESFGLHRDQTNQS